MVEWRQHSIAQGTSSSNQVAKHKTLQATMKKTFITLLTLAGIAMGSPTVLTFDQNEYSFDTDKWSVNGLGNGPNSSWSGSTTLSDKTVASFNMAYGKLWDYELKTKTWSNTTALDFMNQELGTTLTSSDLTGLKFDASAAGSGTTQLTLNFTDNTNYKNGDSVVFYILVAENSHDNGTTPYSGFSVTGLDNATIHWANAEENGFYDASKVAVTGAQSELLMVRVQGSLKDNQSVTFASDNQKNGWAMAAYNTGTANPAVPVIPEPTTATLSLLALCGLAMRRRRK
ncbi:MAG: hypothetical protein IKY92_02100 [Akkermansia sp.]|nr:hypothetical protein [Akkermansia sp.]